MAKQTSTQAADAEVRRALEALKSYAPGSSRGALQPLDEAVAAAARNAVATEQLERQLIQRLSECESVTGKEYICSKLALIGTEACIPALVRLLPKEPLATAARNVLESMPAAAAGKALRASLERVSGTARIGIINSFGARRDAGSLRALTRLVRDKDPTIAGAALAAIGEIGSPRAAAILRAWQQRVPASLERTLTEASLVCAERLVAAGQSRAAATLYQSLNRPEQPRFIRDAVRRGLGG